MEAKLEQKSPPLNLQMDPETALGFVKHGATLLLLDVPQFTLVGIDTQMFSVGAVFKGIKMIPPSPHFVYYCSSNRDGNEFSPIIGFFIDACPSEVIVRKWDKQEERLVKVSEEEEERYCAAVKNLEFDHQLGTYALSHFGDWKRISNYITKSTIERIGGGTIMVLSPMIIIIEITYGWVPFGIVEMCFPLEAGAATTVPASRSCQGLSISWDIFIHEQVDAGTSQDHRLWCINYSWFLGYICTSLKI